MPVITTNAERSIGQPAARERLQEIRQTSMVGAGAETTKVEVPVESAPKEELSPKFADLARKEQRLRMKSQELKAKEDAFKAREAEYLSAYIPKSSIEERFKKDPLGFANEYGVSYDQLAAQALTQPDPSIQKLLKKIEDLESKQSQVVTQQQEQQNQAYEQAVKQIRSEATLLIENDAQFETIKEMGSVDAVVELMKETFNEKGILMNVEDAAREVEAYLIEEAFKMAKMKKVAARLQPQPTEKIETEEKIPTRTLTNAQMASSKPLNSRDRRERAIAAFQGKLN